MSWFRRLIDWMGGGRDAALMEELEVHRACAQEELERAGLSVSEAAAESRRRMGNLTLAREDSRDVWIVRWMDRLRQHLRYGVRGLFREPAFAATAILTLALGTAATTTVFSVVDAEMWRPLPYPDPHRLLSVVSRGPERRGDVDALDLAELAEWRSGAPAFAGLAASGGIGRRTAQLSRAESMRVADVTANYFEVLGRRPMLGDVFRATDARGSEAVVLGERGWRRVFDADPNVVGRTFMLDDRPRVVAGVVAIDDTMGPDAELFLPVDERLSQRAGVRMYGAFGRLAPHATPEIARQQVQALVTRRAERDGTRVGHIAIVEDLSAYYKTRHGGQLYFFLGASALVLLLTIVNVAGLLLARVFRRAPEFALRGALGGGARVIAMQLVVESALIAVPGCALGLLLAYMLVGFTSSVVPDEFLLRGTQIAVDLRVVVFVFLVAIATSIGLVLIPMGIARRANAAVMGSGGRTSAGPKSGRMRAVLLTSQLALTVILIAGAGIFLKSFVALTRIPLGFDPAGGWSMRVVLSGPRFATDDQVRGYANALSAKARAIPGVSRAAIATSSPLRSGWLAMAAETDRDTSRVAPTRTILRAVDSEYFVAVGTRIVRGRGIDATDIAGAPNAAVVNEQFVRVMFPDRDPIGRQVDLSGARTAMALSGTVTIVGVASDIKEVGFNEVAFADVYVAYAQKPAQEIELIVRGNDGDDTMPSTLRAAAAAVDPTVGVTAVSTIDRRVELALQRDRFNLILVAVFAALALVIASIGTYGAMAYSATARWREFGVRLALGATPLGIVADSLWRAARISIIGGAIGIVAAIAIGTILGDALYLVPGVHNGLLFNVKTTDPVVLSLALAGIVVMSLLASAMPARRAGRVNPVSALRAD